MIVASLVAIAPRAGNLVQVVQSLRAQTLRPDRIIVHYSEEPWHLDPGWPVPPQLGALGVELKKVPNLGSCRKYMFAARELRNTDSILILVDDDRVWHPGVFERLVKFVRAEDCVASTRGWSEYRLVPNEQGRVILHDRPMSGADTQVPRQVQVPNSGWATCFRPGHVSEAIFDPAIAGAAHMRYTDEIMLSAMLERPKYVLPMPADFHTTLPSTVHQWRSAETTSAKLEQLALHPYFAER